MKKETAETLIHCSSTPQFPDCERRWAARNIAAEIKAAGYELHETLRHIGAAIGSATHAGIAFIMRDRIKTGTWHPKPDASDCSLEVFVEEVASGPILWDDVTSDALTAEKQILRQVRTYNQFAMGRFIPAMVESRKAANHPSGLVATGKTDITVAQPAKLIDCKTGRHQRANGAQYGGYSRILRAHDNPVDALEEHYLPRLPLSKEQPEPIIINLDLKVAERAFDRIMQRIADCLNDWRKTKDPGAFIANPQSMLCNEKFCPAWDTEWCHEWKWRA